MLISENSRSCIVIELTIPFESNMSKRHEVKLAKDEELCTDLRKQDYKTLLFAIEVGA